MNPRNGWEEEKRRKKKEREGMGNGRAGEGPKGKKEGEGEGPEEGLEFHRIQPEAFFGAQRGLCPPFLSTGARRNGS